MNLDNTERVANTTDKNDFIIYEKLKHTIWLRENLSSFFYPKNKVHFNTEMMSMLLEK